MNAHICVTDVETDKILFINKPLREALHLDKPEGKHCWQVLEQGRTGRCDFCPVPSLRKEGEKASFVWEKVSSATGRTYENFDSLMRWTDGKLVHFHYSIDVTRQHELEKEASLDELTGAYSRRVGKAMLERAQIQCFSRGETLSICMLDVNELKAVNDKHGHLEGDKLLVHITQAGSRVLEKEDFLMRLSGDEFLAVLKNKDSTDGYI